MLSISTIKEMVDTYAVKTGVAYTEAESQNHLQNHLYVESGRELISAGFVVLRHDVLGHVLGGGLPTTEGESVACLIELVFRFNDQYPSAETMWWKYKEFMQLVADRTALEWQMLGYPLTRNGFDEVYIYAVSLLDSYRAMSICPTALVEQLGREVGLQSGATNLIMGMKG